MLRIVGWLLCSTLLASGAAGAQQANPQKNTDLIEAEVRFLDGSIVRVLVLEEQIEVVTKYGKLKVPTADIQRIDFGVHVPDGLEGKIAHAIEQLGNENYKLREAALKELITWGPYAYPQLYRAGKSEEPEVAKRTALALTKIRAKHPAQNLRLREEDIIVTATFTIIGRIITPALKGKSDNFGELNLLLSKLRTMRWFNPSAETEVSVDAEKYANSPDQWMDSGFEVQSGVRLLIVAGGTINLWPQGGNNSGYLCTAKGYGGAGGPNTVRGGTLLAKIGTDGPSFMIGERFEGVPTRDGKLYLQIVPSPWNNASSGSYQVKIKVHHDLDPAD
jgi:hypothetical protein